MLAEKIIAELKHESVSMRKMLERLPADKFDWKPHEKSMTLGRLATHTAELMGFVSMVVTKDETDFATNGYVPRTAPNPQELLQLFDDKLAQAIADLKTISDDTLKNTEWTLRNGDQIFFKVPRMGALRGFAISHYIHHRGQLSVYLRMLDIPVPSIYGPSADEGV